MSRRSKLWETGLSKTLLSDVEERRQYFLSLMEENFTLREALKIVVETIGIKEYAHMTRIKAPNLVTQLADSKDIRLSTLEKMLKPLGVTIAIKSLQASS
jgi:hypothetical protein